MCNGVGRKRVMKTFKSISIKPKSLTPAVMLFVMCSTAWPSLMMTRPRAQETEETQISIRPGELFTIGICGKSLSSFSQQHQTLPRQPKMLRSFETATAQTQIVGSPFDQNQSQALLIRPRFKRQTALYGLNFLSLIYENSLLQANCICSTSGIAR